jgi:hypothetical protein
MPKRKENKKMLSNKSFIDFVNVLKSNLAVITFVLLMYGSSFATGSVSGTVHYPVGSSVNVGKAHVCAKQGLNSYCTDTSDPNGTYTVTGFNSSDPVDVSVSKTNYPSGNAITALDSTRLANHLNGSDPFTTNFQRITGDVSANGTIGGTDQSYLANFVVASTPSGFTGTWDFFTDTSGNPTYPIGSSATSYSYTSVSTAITGADFNGMLLGDCTGNWTN